MTTNADKSNEAGQSGTDVASAGKSDLVNAVTAESPKAAGATAEPNRVLSPGTPITTEPRKPTPGDVS